MLPRVEIGIGTVRNLAAALIGVTLTLAALAQTPDDHVVFDWPSRLDPSRTLQDTVDAAPDGSVVRIHGVHELAEPIWIRSKRLRFVGDGTEGAVRTELVRPAPSARDPIPDADAVVGVLNFIDAGGGIERMRFRGGPDAAIVGRETAAGPRGGHEMRIANVVIREVGRGILWRSTGKITVSDTKITDAAWNGIAIAPLGGPGQFLHFDMHGIDIFDFGNAGIVFVDDPGVCDDDHTVKNATIIGGGGPGILAIRSGVCVFDSHIALTRGAGILAISAAVLLQHSKIFFPTPLLDGRFGDGIVAVAGPGRSVVTVFDNEIKNVHRAYLANYGSEISFSSNEMVCTDGFDLEAAGWLGFPFTYVGPEMQCSDECPAQLGLPPASFKACQAVASTLAPLAPAAPIP
jgi:hypothetical protein